MSDFSDDDFDVHPAPVPVADAATVVPCAPSGDITTHIPVRFASRLAIGVEAPSTLPAESCN